MTRRLFRFFRGFFFAFFLFFCFQTGSAQVTIGWKHTLKNSLNSINKANFMDLDRAGNCYVAGTTWLPDSAKDILLIKFNPNGEEAWRRVYDNPEHGDDIPVCFSLDAEGNVFVAGVSRNKANNADILLVKFSPDGIPVADQRFDGPAHGFDSPTSVRCDRVGNVILAGYETTPDSGINLVVMRFNNNANLTWKRTYATFQMDIANALQTDDSCNVYVAGNSNGGPHSSDMIIEKFDSAGHQKWQRIYDGVFAENDAAHFLVLDEAANLYISGFVNHTSDRSDVPLLKFNRNGEVIREKFYNGHISDCYATSLFIDPNGAYLTLNRTDYGTGVNESMILSYDKLGNEKITAKSPLDVVYQFFFPVSGKSLVFGSKLSHPESTLMPFIAEPDTSGKLLWEFADSTVYGLAHIVKVKTHDSSVYFLGDDTGDATGSISVMNYNLVLDAEKKKKVPTKHSKGALQKN